MRERDFWLFFSAFPKIGPKRFKLILSYFGSAKKAFLAKDCEWRNLGMGEKLVSSFLNFRRNFDFKRFFSNLARYAVRTVCIFEENYPTLLKQSSSPPFVLYFKGVLPCDEKLIAIVGTRKITLYGRETTEKFATELCSLGFTVVSGLARGVDGVAHRAALKAGGRTVAVLGSGIDRIYPAEHIGLANKIIAAGGAVISEYCLGTRALPCFFPARNRIVAGLSLGVLVTEGASKSGTKITASASINEGREVFAVPGPITSPMSDGPSDLIKLGAKLVSNISDILDELPVEVCRKICFQSASGKTPSERLKKEFKVKEEWVVLKAILAGARQIDDIARETQLSISIVSSTLTALEISGKVKNVGAGNYVLI
jgi:DNA processing protein